MRPTRIRHQSDTCAKPPEAGAESNDEKIGAVDQRIYFNVSPEAEELPGAGDFPRPSSPSSSKSDSSSKRIVFSLRMRRLRSFLPPPRNNALMTYAKRWNGRDTYGVKSIGSSPVRQSKYTLA